MNAFTCLSLSPIELAHPCIAVATTRAGGVGVLDTEFCSDSLGDNCASSHKDKAIKNLNKLLELVEPHQSVGLRLRGDRIGQSQTLLSQLSCRPHWLILCRWNQKTLEEILASLPTTPYRRLLLEVTNIDQALALPNLIKEGKGGVDGLVAKGHESGGWGGESSAFLLTQNLSGKQALPIYVQGGIGIHTVGACRAVGAAGVVLDDQLWLMPESPLPGEWQRYLSNLNGQEAIVIGETIEGNCRVLSRPGFQAIPTLQKLAEHLEIGIREESSPQSRRPTPPGSIG